MNIIKFMSRKAGSRFAGKTLIKSLILAVFLGSIAFVSPALAYYPTLTATSQGSGSVLLSVSGGNPNSQIDLSSRQTSSLWTVVSNIGRTDYNGYFSQVISLPSDGSSNAIQLYVTIGGQQSSTVSVYPNSGGCYGTNCGGCTYNCGGSGTLALNQTNVYLSVGQTANVTATNNYYGSLYVSSNSNSSVATAAVYGSGSAISIYGQSAGSDTIVVCASGNTSCASVYVNVTGSTCYSGYCGGCTYNCGSGTLTFSQSSVSLNVGQTSTVTAYNNNGSLYVSSNSNSLAASVSVSGNQVNIYGNAIGTTSVIICSNSSSCGTLYVTVGTNGTGSISLSQTSLNLTYPQTSAVNIYGNGIYGSNYYISSNSNSNVASGSITGSTLYINSLASGSTTIQVCQNSSSSQCASLYITVSGGGGCYNGCGNSLSLSQTSVNLSAGQSSTVTAYGSNGYLYVSSNSNSSVASASISGNNIIFYGITSGSSSFYICANSSSSCAYVYVTVSGSSGGGSGTITFSPSSESLNLGQSATVSIYSPNYYSSAYAISSNYNSSVAYASISGNSLYLTANASGSTSIIVCQNGTLYCGTLYVTVGNGAYGNFSLSQTSLSLTTGQTSSVNIYGGSSYYVSNNTSPYVATANVSGSTLTVYGLQNGSTTITICQGSSSSCVTLYITVSGSGGSYGGLTLSQSSLNLSVGQTVTVNASGNGGYGFFLGTNSNPSVATANFNGSVISVYGLQNGTTNIQVCQNNSSGCVSLYVSVGNTTYSNGGGGLQYPGGTVLGASTYSNGQLINENGTVYIVYKNTKTGFSSASVFTGLGFKFYNVLPVGYSGLNSSGYTVNTAYSSHPWGSWIKSGSTVYFVHESGLIPVPDWNTFLNNSGSASLIVPANTYDFRLPVLSPMVYSDPRLQ